MLIYRLLMLLLAPALLFRGKGTAERLGFGPAPAGAIWVHGASNGEITSARPLIEALATQGPVLVTCNNPTARVMVQAWALPDVTARLAPLDLAPVVARCLRRWQPRALIVIENELWPERILQASRRMPVMVVGARMSERSARRWAKIGLMRRVMGAIAWVSAQDAGTEARLVALGLPQDRLGPRLMLKAGVRVGGTALPAPELRPEVLLAASTHEGEDGLILDAFAAQNRFRWLILAPRHPRRGAEVAALARAKGLEVRQRSAGDAPGGAVYVADTLGEMATWYATAGATLIGGTFAEKGGHTPFEPAQAQSALLHGPSIHNFAEVFARLDTADAALPVMPETLAQVLETLTPERQAELARNASATLADAADIAPILAALDARLPRKQARDKNDSRGGQ